MHFAVFIDDLLGRKSVILKEESFKEAQELFEADSWEEAIKMLDFPKEGYRAALVCLPIHAAYITYIDSIDLRLAVERGQEVIVSIGDEDMSLYYDPGAMMRRKMLNRELREDGLLKDIIAGPLIVVPQQGDDGFTRAYDIFGKGQAFIFDSERNDIKTVKCSSMALAVLRENNISLIA